MKDTDRRVKYTKMVLKQSMISLLSTKPLSRISVTELCKQADVNRGTFYAHYKEPYELFKQIEDDFMEEILHSYRNYSCKTLEEANNELFKLFYTNREMCRMLLGENNDDEFIRRLMDLIHDFFKQRWQFKLDEIQLPEEYVYDYVAAGCFEIVKRWLQSDKDIPPEEMAGMVTYMVKRTMTAWCDCCK